MGIKDIYLTVGYKSKLFNFLNLRNLNLKLFILKILETVVLFIAGILYKNCEEKKNLILLHSDLLFDNSYLSLLKKHNIVFALNIIEIIINQNPMQKY